MRKSRCNVKVKDYKRMFHATPQTLTCGKVSITMAALDSHLRQVGPDPRSAFLPCDAL